MADVVVAVVVVVQNEKEEEELDIKRTTWHRVEKILKIGHNVFL
jgi:hypothetical protein